MAFRPSSLLIDRPLINRVYPAENFTVIKFFVGSYSFKFLSFPLFKGIKIERFDIEGILI